MLLPSIAAAGNSFSFRTSTGEDPAVFLTLFGLILGPMIVVNACLALARRRRLGRHHDVLVGRVVRIDFKAIADKSAMVRVVDVGLPDGSRRTVEDESDVAGRLVTIGDEVAVWFYPGASHLEIPRKGRLGYIAHQCNALLGIAAGMAMSVAGVAGFWHQLIVYRVL